MTGSLALALALAICLRLATPLFFLPLAVCNGGNTVRRLNDRGQARPNANICKAGLS